nr:unnamed protein product [Callosobruchus chinensis]
MQIYLVRLRCQEKILNLLLIGLLMLIKNLVSNLK